MQLREKDMAAAELAVYCSIVRRWTSSFKAAFILNDYVSLAGSCGADGVHLGQQDTPPLQARTKLGDDALIGLSTHSEAEVVAAGAAPVDYVGVGPVFSTPTKPGRKPVGTALVSYATSNAEAPFFAIGGIDFSNLDQVLEAGARRVAVIRAITEADDPLATATAFKKKLASVA